MSKISKWGQSSISAGLYVNIVQEYEDADEWRGCGKEYNFPLQGSWGELIDLARAILQSENTRLVAPELHEAAKQLDGFTYSYEFEVKESDA